MSGRWDVSHLSSLRRVYVCECAAKRTGTGGSQLEGGIFDARRLEYVRRVPAGGYFGQEDKDRRTTTG
jgi:hypothetical protein